jgi:hypothetical protein
MHELTLLNAGATLFKLLHDGLYTEENDDRHQNRKCDEVGNENVCVQAELGGHFL